MLAVIAGTVSYLHMHLLVELHAQPGWVAALRPPSVDGMIVAASTTLLADSRSGSRDGLLPARSDPRHTGRNADPARNRANISRTLKDTHSESPGARPEVRTRTRACDSQRLA
jgi:hypothetical protein